MRVTLSLLIEKHMTQKNEEKKSAEIDRAIRKKISQREAENKALKKILEQIKTQPVK